jgi:NADH-quinone oxidoreductase subunit N
MLDRVDLFPLLLPATATLVGALVVLGSEPFLDAERKHRFLPWFAAIATVLGMLALLVVQPGHAHGIYAMDSARMWLSAAVLAATAISVGGLQLTLDRDRYPGGEPYALLLLAATGAQLMVLATDWLALFVGIEMASLSVYALVGLRRHRVESGEGLYKYFIMGGVFSAVLLYGVALTYGATGTTHLGGQVLEGRGGLFLLGQTMILVGLLFKVGAVPFHFWSPDAYTGAPAAITGFMGAVIKVGGFAALGAMWLNLLASLGGNGLPPGGVLALDQGVVVTASGGGLAAVQQIVLVVAVLSLFIGHFSGLRQTSVRRMIAYSSVANAGYMLLAFALPAQGGTMAFDALWIYLVGYAITTAGILTAAAWLAGDEDRGDDLRHLAGQARRSPFHGLILTIFIASVAGLPPTIGFLGKFLILSGLVAKGWLIVAILAMGMALVGAAYYLGLLGTLWSAQPVATPPARRLALAGWTLAIGAVATIGLCWPGLLIH